MPGIERICMEARTGERWRLLHAGYFGTLGNFGNIDIGAMLEYKNVWQLVEK